METKTRKPGSGRTKGSFSFVKVDLCQILAQKMDAATLQDLTTRFPGLCGGLVVSRVWAESVGLSGLVAKPSNAIMDSIAGETPTSKIAVTTTDLDA